VSQFVDQCRQEWSRLGVPDPVANEMAADLEADLKEAESEGVSAEEVLGNGAFDPRSFAASWARERGLVQYAPAQPPAAAPPPAEHRAKQPRTLSLVLAFAVLAVVGAVLLIIGSRQALAVVGPVMGKPVPASPGFPFRPPGTIVQPGAAVQFVGPDPLHAAGSLLLLIGVAGMITMLVLWSWRRLRPPVAAA
jgi:hypothetical protein